MNIYKTFVSAGGCNYSLKINNHTIQKSEDGSIITTETPLNEWMLFGYNLLEISIAPLNSIDYGKAAYFECSFFTGVDRANKETELFSFDKHEFKANEYIKQRETFTITDATLKNTLLQDLPIIDLKATETIQNLYQVAHEVYQLFELKKKDEILQYFNQRQLDYSLCYGKSSQTLINNLSTSLDTVFKEPYEILNFVPQKLSPTLNILGKLITLNYHEYDVPFINFSNKNDRTVIKSFPVYFGQKEDKQLFVCR